ncbi:MAG TPA: hypothetical protein PLU38_13260, partial [Kiritimatiellia bacterium]|nr:hypothetical protein [Kiritimatiellia bacterium]
STCVTIASSAFLHGASAPPLAKAVPPKTGRPIIQAPNSAPKEVRHNVDTFIKKLDFSSGSRLRHAAARQQDQRTFAHSEAFVNLTSPLESGGFSGSSWFVRTHVPLSAVFLIATAP